jgi:hypothetical protein
MVLLRAVAIVAAIGAWTVGIAAGADLADFVRPAAPAPAPPALAPAPSPAPAPAPAPAATDASRPVSVRVVWGGGTPQAWAGSIEVHAPGGRPTRLPFTWRTLSGEPDAAAAAHEAAGAIAIHQPRAIASDGVELSVADWQDARLVVRLAPVDAPQPGITLDAALADIVATGAQEPLDTLGNRLTVKAAPGDALRVGVAAGGAEVFTAAADDSVHRPGERIRLRVEPLLATPAHGVVVELRMRLKAARQQADLAAQAVALEPATTIGGLGGDRSLTAFAPVVFDVTLPGDEGAYDVVLEAVERGGLRWARAVVARTVPFVAISDAPAEPAPQADWKPVHELDPGSPRLHERLRRLPGVHLPAMGLPEVPLPSLARPSMPLPRLPSVPLPHVSIPSVPLPSVSAMVPRLSGLLATGHSTVIAHPLGAMLRLPPARQPGEPAWEGIVLAAVQPGLPHAVEIDYPVDQDATFAVSVLEADAAGVVVESRHEGGFEVRRPAAPGAGPRLATHRLVFWPTTRHPVVMIANLATDATATFGRVRVAVGPAGLPVVAEPPLRPAAADAGRPARRTFAALAAADLARTFGGAGRAGEGGGKASSDWLTHLSAIRHSAELLRAERAAGALVTVFARGAAAWPCDLTRHAARTTPAEAEPFGGDVASATARLYARHGLAVIPALAFDAPLPELEAALAAGDAPPGIACVGRDGKPRRTPTGVHYNILDPRVQEAVERLVLDGVGRFRGATNVEGVALVLTHDGWLHLPGIAWGLDDATFARFAAGLPAPPSLPADDSRFAERGRLVEGTLRDAWLAWRCREVAAFHARLAVAVAATDPRRGVYVVPTTLFTTGALAAALQPAFGGPAEANDVVRMAGLDPAAPPAPGARVVFVAPQVHAGGATLRERATCVAANRAVAVAAAASVGGRAAAIVEQPLSLSLTEIVPHGPFGNAAAVDGASALAPLADGSVLAEAVAAVDPDVVFDMRLTTACTAAEPARRAFEALPALAFTPLRAAPAPLTVRHCRTSGATWVLVVNRAAVPARAIITLGTRPAAVVDAVDGTTLALASDRELALSLDAWAVRALILDGDVAVDGARVEYADDVRAEVMARVAGLRLRRAVLEAPVPLDVLDNPGFELGVAEPAGKQAASLAGWEVVEPRRGAVAAVPGLGQDGPGRAVEFSSFNGLATLRSNPFVAPKTGRISVAAWLRVPEGGAQPPLRIAIEGVQGDREYYRFAAVGGLTGGRPLTGTWSQFVLQVDDLPAEPLESLRVRFDLLGPGRVQVDDVRVFDLAFDESQRARLTMDVSLLEHALEAGDLGACLERLAGYGPAFLEAFVSDDAIAAAQKAAAPAPDAPATEPAPRQAGGMLDRMRSWWQ